MTLATEADIEEFADSIRGELGGRVERVILFGSYSRDEHVPGSDIDIAVIVSGKQEGDEKKIWDIAERYLAEEDLYFSPKIYEKSEFDQKIEEGFSFYKEVERGIEV